MSQFFIKIFNSFNMENLFGKFNFLLFGNTVKSYLLSIIIFIIQFIILLIAHKIIINKLLQAAKKTETLFDDFMISLMDKNFFPILYYGAFFISTRNLKISGMPEKIIKVIGIILLAILLIRFTTNAVRYILINYVFKEEKYKSKISMVKGIFPVINIIIWTLGIIFLLDNLGFNISAIVAGLGIGGIAIALAAQSILGDLFSFFALIMDKPFEVGDFIIIDNHMGTVEQIGIKTTRIRDLEGEQIIFTNSNLINSRIKNYKRMDERRILFTLQIVYETDKKKLAEIPEIIKKIINSFNNIRFDRSHFKSYGDFCLYFETVYFILSSDYNIYMDTQQEINLKIYEEFDKEQIKFAHPTQILYLKKQD